MEPVFDSRSLTYKSPFGCVRQQEACTMRIYMPRRMGVRAVALMVRRDGQAPAAYPMAWESLEEGYDVYTVTLSLSDCGLYFYWFAVTVPEGDCSILRAPDNTPAVNNGLPWQITCYSREFDTPACWKGAVMYQIFPDRFYRAGDCDVSEKLQPFLIHDKWGDTPAYVPQTDKKVWNCDFFGGNLRGILEKLPYLQNLGVTVLYLNPIFMAFSNHRYDTADYRRIDPMLGTEEDFRTLCRQAHALGMRVVLDGVFSHTGSDSVYFDKNNRFGGGAYHNPHSPYRSWYQFQSWPEEYTAWWGIETLPCVNEMDNSYLDFIMEGEDSVIAHWLRAGADGFRLDVADELPDAFIERLHRRVKEIKPDGLVIGEVWEDASNKESYGVRRTYFTKPELDSVMNYPFREAILALLEGRLDGAGFAQAVMTIVEHYPKPVLDCVMNNLSTHDTPRILTLLGEQASIDSRDERARHQLTDVQLQRAIEREMVAAALQFCLPGMACIYYGDEVGLQGFEDPFNRRCYPWGDENQKLLAGYRQLGALKSSYAALQTGDILFLNTKGRGVVFQRSGQPAVTLAVNVDSQPMVVCTGGRMVKMCRNAQQQVDSVVLKENGFAIFV